MHTSVANPLSSIRTVSHCVVTVQYLQWLLQLQQLLKRPTPPTENLIKDRNCILQCAVPRVLAALCFGDYLYNIIWGQKSSTTLVTAQCQKTASSWAWSRELDDPSVFFHCYLGSCAISELRSPRIDCQLLKGNHLCSLW